MKKLTSWFLTMVITLSGVTAMAEDSTTSDPTTQDVYNNVDNAVSPTDVQGIDGYTTVLIKKDSSDEIVYIDQSPNGFSSVASFMLKKDIADGNYTATFGNKDGDTKTVKFFKGEFKVTQGIDDKGEIKEIDGMPFDTSYKMEATEAEKQDADLSKGIEEGDYKKDFTLLINSLEAFDTAYMLSADGTTCYGYFELPKPDTELTDASSIAYALQLFNIPEDKKGINLYLGNAPDQSQEVSVNE